MSRLNLTLDPETIEALERHAQGQRRPLAAVARDLLVEALDRRARNERRQMLINDYRRGHDDGARLLAQMEGAQVLADEDDDGPAA